ncbi:uncharacterized protein [Haliotis cracherodii]|uniref:uncharacterized protein n=1 Tax=Haliotis cracherodii TaxID=6455 RepID=UPI0039ECBAD3
MPLLTNTRAEKVRRLCKQGSEMEGPGQIRLFEEALTEAEHLGTNREINVCICRLNLATAYVHSADRIQTGIDMLSDMTTTAEKHHPVILSDIYYYKAVGMMRVKGTRILSRTESDGILHALYQAKQYDDDSGSDTCLKQYILTALLRIERKDSERCELLKGKILAYKQVRDSEDVDSVLQMVYEMMNLLLKRDPKEAKEEGRRCLAVIPEDDSICTSISTTTWCDLGLVYTQIQEYRNAVKYFERSHGKLQKADLCAEMPQQCLQMRHNIAAVYLLQKDFTAAVSTYTGEDGEKSLDDLRKEIQDKDLLSHAYLNLAFAYLRRRFPENDSLGQEEALQLAYTNYKTALDIQIETGDMEGAHMSLEGLAATVLTMERSVKTLEWMKLYLGLMDYQAEQLKANIGKIVKELAAMKSDHDELVKEKEISKTDHGQTHSVEGKRKRDGKISGSKTLNKKNDSKTSIKKAESSSAAKNDSFKSAGKNDAESISAGIEPESHSTCKKDDSQNADSGNKSHKSVKDKKPAREELPA